ncbi:hypothetical protein GCM10010172_02170 [Paractinoplanes ferrugineus]|uniref:Uncharacterized protein n=1 Tax=Paractinoplanes ferrugineus TaxID=113564 RepID=A0A919J7J5_9ACTN|nr:hypothetical protein Afe05nite_59040 [Actinoplanes ferrugineus]
MLTLNAETRMTCAKAVVVLPKDNAGGSSARPVPVRRDNAGTRERGSRPALGITCCSAVTSPAVTSPFTTATCRRASR